MQTSGFKTYIGILIAFIILGFGLNTCSTIGDGMSRDIISGNVDIYGRYTITSSTMTIYAGAEVKFKESGGTIGCEKHTAEFRISTDAALKASGTSLRPITFTGAGSFIVEAGSRNDTVLEYCDFGTIEVTIENPSITITNCTRNGQPYP